VVKARAILFNAELDDLGSMKFLDHCGSAGKPDDLVFAALFACSANAEKFLVYATGRTLSFGDRKEIEGIVRETRERGIGFQDLIIGFVLSELFQTK
jgi:hypothetical protein